MLQLLPLLRRRRNLPKTFQIKLIKKFYNCHCRTPCCSSTILGPYWLWLCSCTTWPTFWNTTRSLFAAISQVGKKPVASSSLKCLLLTKKTCNLLIVLYIRSMYVVLIYKPWCLLQILFCIELLRNRKRRIRWQLQMRLEAMTSWFWGRCGTREPCTWK